MRRSAKELKMRWFHEGIDRLYIGLMHRLVPPVFRRGSASPSLHEHLASVELQVSPLATDRRRYTLAARTRVGDLQAGFRWREGSHPTSPVLIFHHGLGEIPYDHTFRGIFRRDAPADAHLVAIRAPFHRSHIDCCRGLASLSRFLAMCAVSVAAIEAVRQAFAARGARNCVVAGISLGGFLTLLHHLAHGTADTYLPLMAGPDLAHALLSTPCRRLLASRVRTHPAHLTACLDHRESFRASDTRRVFPLLARHDLWMPLAYHQAEYTASGVSVTLINRGHMTGSWAFTDLRAHLLAHLRASVSHEPLN
jgi:hypothetical protein